MASAVPDFQAYSDGRYDHSHHGELSKHVASPDERSSRLRHYSSRILTGCMQNATIGVVLMTDEGQ